MQQAEILQRKNFQTVVHGKPTDLFYISSKNISATLTNYGARMVSLLVPDKDGNAIDVNVGFDSIEKYVTARDQCYGAIVGRYAGRIANGKFVLNGDEYQLTVNNGTNAIHGGNTGFQTRVWDVVQADESTVTFSYLSADGEEGYPGSLLVQVMYRLTKANELLIQFTYTSSKRTIANIINHNFWNLNGEGSGTILHHQLQINADRFNAINAACIPTHLASVKNSSFDFTSFHAIGERINASDVQLKNGTGYDHTYACDKGVSENPELVATAIGDQSGIGMEIYTTEPGVHFYTGNFMQGQHTCKNGTADDARTAFCLETQHYPNSPNEPAAPTTVKEAGKVYTSTTLHKFFNI
jgi:aldose 1-epimerase